MSGDLPHAGVLHAADVPGRVVAVRRGQKLAADWAVVFGVVLIALGAIRKAEAQRGPDTRLRLSPPEDGNRLATGQSAGEIADDVVASGRPATPKAVLRHATPFLFGAVPTLAPLVLLGLFADSEVVAAVVWRGDVVKLSLGVVPLALPSLVAAAILVLGYWFGASGRAALLSAATAMAILLLVVPLSFAVPQGAVVALTFAALSSNRPRRWTRLTAALLSLAVVLGTLAVAGHAGRPDPRWSTSVQRAAVGRALATIPQECITYVAGSGKQPQIVRVVAVDDQYVTAIAGGYPPVMTLLENSSIETRRTCPSPRTWPQRSVVDLLFAGRRDHHDPAPAA